MVTQPGVRLDCDLVEWLFNQGVRLYGTELLTMLWIWLSGIETLGSPNVGEHLMQIFVDDLEEFDANIDRQGFTRIWRSCHTSAWLDILLRRFDGFVRSMPTSERFRFITDIISSRDSPVVIFNKIELCGGNASLHEFYMLHGSMVLHHVARALTEYQASAHLDLWTGIGVTATQNGADPVTVVNQRTPLLRFLFKQPPLKSDPLESEHMLSTRSISKRLQPWMHMLASANVDIPTYFSRESEAWQSVDVYVPYHVLDLVDCRTRLFAVQYDASSQRYSIYVRHDTRVPIKLLHRLPGSFTDQSLVPNTICWDPSTKETEEGHWIAARSGKLVLVGEVMDLHKVIGLLDSSIARTVLYERLVDPTQDDNGVLMRILDKSCHSPRLRKRSSSQPISIAQRRYDDKTAHSRSHEWLPPVHYCIGMSAWIIDKHRSPRHCVRYDITQEDRHEDFERGFLAKALACRTGSRAGMGVEEGLHDFARSCTWECGKIDLSTLAIPQSLPHWHPGYCEPPRGRSMLRR
jgi:hypothetical protein